MSEAEYRVLPQLETVVSVCLTTLAAGYSDQAKKYRERVESDRHTLTQAKLTFQEAGKLFEQASYLTPYNSEEYLNLVKLTADNHFELGKTTFELEIYKKAREEFEKAAKLNIEEPKYQSHLALADAHIYKELRATDSSREYHATLARNSCEKVLEALKGVFDVDATSKESSNQTAEILKQVECTYALLDDEEQRSHVVKMRNFLSCLAEDRCKGELAINDLEKKLLEYKVYEWQYTQISLALGYTYLQMNKPEKVQKHFQKAIDTLEDKYPQEIRKQELRALLIYSLLDQQKYEEAIQEAEHALLHEPFCFFERKALGDTYFAMNEFGQAIHAWQDALFRKDAFLRKSTFLPKPPELLKRKIADINFKIGLSYLELARQSVEPSKRKASFQQAAAYLKLSRDQSGEYDLQRKSYYFLGMLHLDSGEYEEAISHFKIAEDLQFARLYSLFYLGYAYLKNTEYDKGLKQFQILLTETQELERKQIPITKIVVSEVKTASVEPLSLGEIIMLAFWGQAFTYAERDMNLHEALRLIRQAQEYMEKIEKDKAVQLQYPAKCWDCQGWILYKQGKIDDAIKCLECALSKTADAEIYLHLALAYDRKLKTCKNDVQLTAQLEACCLHAHKLDFKKECEPTVRDILQRLHGQALHHGDAQEQ